MRQTTCGEIRKVKIYDADKVEIFLKKIDTILSDQNLKNCIYENKKVISSKALNFLNLQDSSRLENQLKFLIRNAYDECEKAFPFSGDMFIENFFNSKLSGEYDTFRFTKQHESEFIDTLSSQIVKDIAVYLLKNTSLERTVTVEKTHLEQVSVETNDDVMFNIDYDTDFLGDKFYHYMKDYRIVILDGFVETVGEIHHFLHNAAETKLPHVIICFGMSDEVKHTIMTNNSRGNTEIMPVVLTLDSETANILNDFGVLHSADVISALKGQTISQAVRSNLVAGKRITFFKNKILIDPICSNLQMMRHRNFLTSRINNAPPETDKAPIRRRLKNFSAKSTKIFIPQNLYNNVQFLREIDYMLRFLNCLSQPIARCEGKFLPFYVIEDLQKKINSLLNTYHNIDKAVILSK